MKKKPSAPSSYSIPVIADQSVKRNFAIPYIEISDEELVKFFENEGFGGFALEPNDEKVRDFGKAMNPPPKEENSGIK